MGTMKCRTTHRNYVQAGVAFYAFDKDCMGRVPIYEHYSNDQKDHMYSTNSTAPDSWEALNNREPVFYAFPQSYGGLEVGVFEWSSDSSGAAHSYVPGSHGIPR